MIPVHDSIFVHERGLLWDTVVSLIVGGGATRFLVYLSKAMPPLPPNSGWWKEFFYKLVKNVSGLDPNSTVISPNDVK